MLWRSAFVLSVAHLTFGSPLSGRWGDLVGKHSWAEISKGWEIETSASPDHVFDLRIGLKQDKFDKLIFNLMETGDPFHERYGQHLGKDEVDALVAPHSDSTRAVEEWLSFHGIDPFDAIHRTDAGDWMTVRVSVAQAEPML